MDPNFWLRVKKERSENSANEWTPASHQNNKNRNPFRRCYLWHQVSEWQQECAWNNYEVTEVCYSNTCPCHFSAHLYLILIPSPQTYHAHSLLNTPVPLVDHQLGHLKAYLFLVAVSHLSSLSHSTSEGPKK